MSHELRTPLNSILGYAQILDSLPDDTPIGKERECTRAIVQSGWYLLRLIKDLLDLTAIEADKVEIYLENVKVSSCIDECLVTIGPIAKERAITIDVSPVRRDLVVLADRIRMKQALLNLLTNATKYNRRGGSIKVNCQRSQAGGIRISVTDTGSGIPSDDVATLFEPFSRFHKGAQNIEGAGIGLAVTKQLAELMGGAVGVSSRPGQGSTFWIELKEGKETVSMEEDRSIASYQVGADPSKKFTMLYIEDSPSHTNLMKRVVADMGNIDIITAHTPKLGLDLASTHKPDIIICDICLPGMDGYEVLNHLKSDERTKSIPVVAISANIMDSEVEKGLRAGFRRYLSKPIDITDFRKTLNDLLNDEASTASD